MGLTIFLQITEAADIWIGYANQKRESETASSPTTVRRTRPDDPIAGSLVNKLDYRCRHGRQRHFETALVRVQSFLCRVGKPNVGPTFGTWRAESTHHCFAPG
jgi:hypothetical protein